MRGFPATCEVENDGSYFRIIVEANAIPTLTRLTTWTILILSFHWQINIHNYINRRVLCYIHIKVLKIAKNLGNVFKT